MDYAMAAFYNSYLFNKFKMYDHLIDLQSLYNNFY